MRKLFILFFFSLATISCVSQKEAIPKKTKIFFLGGQSNMDGRARAYNLTEEDKARLKKAQNNVVLYYNYGEGKPLDTTKVEPHTARKFGAEYLFGPELFFGIEMSEKYPDHKIILIKRSKGGMSLYGAWNTEWSLKKATLMGEAEQPKMFQEFLEYSNSVLSGLDPNSYEISGMLWVQGETDSSKRFGSKPAETYEENLKKLIKEVRSEFRSPELPFLIFQVGGGKVVEGMQNIAKADKNVVLIPQEYNDKNSEYYFERNDPPIGHYTYPSMKKIGVFFAEYYINNFAK